MNTQNTSKRVQRIRIRSLPDNREHTYGAQTYTKRIAWNINGETLIIVYFGSWTVPKASLDVIHSCAARRCLHYLNSRLKYTLYIHCNHSIEHRLFVDTRSLLCFFSFGAYRVLHTYTYLRLSIAVCAHCALRFLFTKCIIARSAVHFLLPIRQLASIAPFSHSSHWYIVYVASLLSVGSIRTQCIRFAKQWENSVDEANRPNFN